MNLSKTLRLSLQWLVICALIGLFSGSASAFFLVALEWVTKIREHNAWLIWLLPIGGLIIGLLYHYYGASVSKGNNLLLEEYENPQQPIPFKMAPLVLIGTLITHLVGGSAGREGTAVQMGGAIADQFSKLFHLNKNDRKTILILGISAGFASVFGTPLAGALFALNSYAGCSARLAGLTWGAEDLATAVGASTNKKDNGEFDDTFVLARSLCLLAAAHAGVQAIDTLSVDFRHADSLQADVQRAKRQGFSGKLAIHPDQVAIINAGFTATPEELQHAQRIVDAFAQAGGAGAVQLDGKMVDKPHLTQALRLLSTRNGH
jgi:hypothetical protein